MAHIEWLNEDDPTKRKAKLVWECKTLNGERKRKSHVYPVGTPMRVIKSDMREYERRYELSEGCDYSKKTFGEFIDIYFQEYGMFLSPSTIQRHLNICNSPKNGLKKFLGDIRLEKLSVRDCQAYCNYLVSSELSPKTIKNMMMVGSTIYQKALILHYVEKDYNVFSRVVLPKVRKKPVQAYTKEEVKILLQMMDEQPCFLLRCSCYLAVGLGLRRSEMAALQIEDIDFEKKQVNISKARVQTKGSTVLKGTKSEAGNRTLPLSPTMSKILREAIKRYNLNKMRFGADFCDSRYIFSNPNGTPQGVNSITSRWNRTMKKQDTLPYLKFHSLRGTFCSIAMENTPPKLVQTWMGHSSIQTSLNFYTKTYYDSMVNYAESLDNLIFAKEA